MKDDEAEARMPVSELPFHPLANLSPLMEGAEFAALIEAMSVMARGAILVFVQLPLTLEAPSFRTE